MRIACLGGGPAGLYFAIAMKLRDPAPRDHRGRAQPARRHVRLGRGAVGRDARQPRRQRSRQRRGDPPRVRLLGRHRRLLPGHGDALVRPRLLRHRPQAAAQYPAGAGAGARRRAALRDRDRRPRALSRLRPGRRRRRRQLQGARRPWRTSSSPTSTCAPASTSGSARTPKFDDAFTFIFEETEHGWIWAHAYQFDADTATFIVECSEATWRRVRLRAHEPGGDDRRLRADLRQESRRPPADDQRPPPARLGLAQLQPRAVRDAGRTRTSC